MASQSEESTWLEQDKEIPGQKYVCLSFLSPEKVLANKDIYFFTEFLKDYEVQYKIQATEKFLMSQVQILTNAISKVEDMVANSLLEELEAQKKAVAASLAAEKAKEDLSGATVDLSGAQTAADASAAADKAAEEAKAAADPKKWRDDVVKHLTEVRAKISRDAADDLAYYVKTNMRDFKTTTIQQAYDDYLFKNRKRLEDEFFQKNEFRTSVRGLKVRGVYDTQAEAAARAKSLQKQDPYFNVYVGQVGFWLPWDPEPTDISEQEYAEEQLNTLMKSYKQNEQQKEALYEEEKRQRLQGSKTGAVKVGPGATLSSSEPPKDMFSEEGDLAIRRKKEAAAGKTLDL